MDFRHLKSFITVAEELNIGRAAKRLCISQPPLTRQIQQLEEDVGASLLIRTARGVELTEAGRVFLGEARNILSLARLAVERSHKAALGKLGRIDVGIFGSGIFGTIPKMLLAYRQACPEVNVVLHSMNKGEQVEALRQRRINVGFNRLLAYEPDIVSEVITMEGLYLALYESHPLVATGDIHWRELAGQPLVMFPSSTRPNFIDRAIELCKLEGFEPVIAQEVGDAVYAIALVASGFGLCIVPESATNLRLPGVRYRRLVRDPLPMVDLSCIYRRDDDSAILQSFLDVGRTFRAE
ncbi:MAG: LysR family transcriptional regulator [Pseudomonadota bacterium]|nr:LysR family transcriptional regulator [Pseudomonadota bacterium]